MSVAHVQPWRLCTCTRKSDRSLAVSAISAIVLPSCTVTSFLMPVLLRTSSREIQLTGAYNVHKKCRNTRSEQYLTCCIHRILCQQETSCSRCVASIFFKKLTWFFGYFWLGRFWVIELFFFTYGNATSFLFLEIQDEIQLAFIVHRWVCLHSWLFLNGKLYHQWKFTEDNENWL